LSALTLTTQICYAAFMVVCKVFSSVAAVVLQSVSCWCSAREHDMLLDAIPSWSCMLAGHSLPGMTPTPHFPADALTLIWTAKLLGSIQLSTCRSGGGCRYAVDWTCTEMRPGHRVSVAAELLPVAAVRDVNSVVLSDSLLFVPRLPKHGHLWRDWYIGDDCRRIRIGVRWLRCTQSCPCLETFSTPEPRRRGAPNSSRERGILPSRVYCS
jgi:hypothetical protein